jgi:hypothetical protein
MPPLKYASLRDHTRTSVPFEPNGFYLILMGDTSSTTTSWHWALYLAMTAIGGSIFHIVEAPFVIPSTANSQQLPPTPPPSGDAYDNDLDLDSEPDTARSRAPHAEPAASSSSSSTSSSTSATPPSPRQQSNSHWPPWSTEKVKRRLTFEECSSNNHANISEWIVLALKVAVVEPPEDMHGPLAERLSRVPIRQDDTSRSWAMEALRQLDNEGWVALGATSGGGLKDSVDMVEQEAADAACANSLRDRRTTEVSRFFVG